jgi:hypothetical protein
MKKQFTIGLITSACLFAGAIAISLPQTDTSDTNHSKVQNAANDINPYVGDLKDPMRALPPQ